MSDIEFITDGKIPLCLKVKVDGVSVTYSGYGKGGCIEFTAWTADREKAFDAVEKIVYEIIRERSDYKHFVSWRTESLEVVEHAARYGYTRIEWKYYLRDSG